MKIEKVPLPDERNSPHYTELNLVNHQVGNCLARQFSKARAPTPREKYNKYTSEHSAQIGKYIAEMGLVEPGRRL